MTDKKRWLNSEVVYYIRFGISESIGKEARSAYDYVLLHPYNSILRQAIEFAGYHRSGMITIADVTMSYVSNQTSAILFFK